MPGQPAVVTWGRRAWAALGLLAVAALLLVALDAVRVVAVAVVLAMFPAALLTPVAEWLRRRGVPGAVIGLSLVLALLALLAGAVWLLLPGFLAQLPALVDAVVDGVQQLEDALDWSALPVDAEGIDDLLDRAAAAFGGGDVLSQGLAAATAVVDVLTGTLLLLVALFFYLKDGRRLWRGVLDLFPGHRQKQLDTLATQAWWTIGAYLRGQLLVALVDAVFIGLGLLLLGVPLALPLAVLVFLGGLFPIVGAFLSGLLAVLVALADQGPGTALLVLGLVIAVQQLEGNLLEPLIMANIIALHPLVIILAVTAGGLLLGVLGAFLAVPFAAVTARIVDHLRGRAPAAGPGAPG